MKQTYLLICILIILTSCASNAFKKLSQTDINQIKYFGCAEVVDDPMDSTAYVTMDTKIHGCGRSRAIKTYLGFSSYQDYEVNFDVFPRILINKQKKNKMSYQLYFIGYFKSWRFLNRYKMKIGTKFSNEKKLDKVDREVILNGQHKVEEHYVSTFSKKEFYKILKYGAKIKAYGKRGDVTIDINTTSFKDIARIANDFSKNKLKYKYKKHEYLHPGFNTLIAKRFHYPFVKLIK